MASEPKKLIVDIIRDNWENPNSNINSKNHRGVFVDYPHLKLSKESYPRVSVIETDSPRQMAGIGTSAMESEVNLEIGIWVKEAHSKDELFEVDGEKCGELKLVDKIEADLISILRENWGNNNYFYDFEILSVGEALFDIDRRSYFKSFTIVLKSLEY